MFRPVPMVRLRALILGRQQRSVLRRLGRLGTLQLTRTFASSETAPLEPMDRARELARCDRLQARIAEVRRALGIDQSSMGSGELVSYEQADRLLGSWEERTRTWVRRREQVQRRLEKLEAEREQVKPYCGLQLPLEQLGASSFLHFVTGTLPPGKLEQLTPPAQAVLLPLPQHKGRQPLVALISPGVQPALEAMLARAGFEPDVLPLASGSTPEGIVDGDQLTQNELASQLRDLDQEGRTLAAAATEPLAGIQQCASQERQLCEAEQLFPRTEASVLISGWVASSEAPAARSEIMQATEGCCAVKMDDAKGVATAEVPVLLRHSRLLRPFEMLVRAYGLPAYGDLAPTLFVAVSYVLMFGMMFGDAGHGGLLALLGGGLVVASRTASKRDIGLLLLVNGLSSAAFGVAYGSYFGLPQLKRYALWRDPLEGDPMTLMLLAVGIGVVLMSVGVLLNIINRLRRRDWTDGLLGKFGVIGVVFYWGSLALVTKSAAIQAQGWWTWALLLFLALPITCWAVKEPLAFWRHRAAGQAPESGGMTAAVTESLVGAFEGVLLYLANTISFVRLAAYAMSHAALLMATFTLADQVQAFPTGGTVWWFLVVVLGNVIALVLEGIVAAVQALRLEYYEFFGKFFSGDGQPFKPFSLVTKSPHYQPTEA